MLGHHPPHMLPFRLWVKSVNVHPRKLKCSKMAFNTDLRQEKKKMLFTLMREAAVRRGPGALCRAHSGATQRTTRYFLAGSSVLPPSHWPPRRKRQEVFTTCTSVWYLAKLLLNACIRVSRWPTCCLRLFSARLPCLKQADLPALSTPQIDNPAYPGKWFLFSLFYLTLHLWLQ